MINRTNQPAAFGTGIVLVALGIFFLIVQYLDVNMWGIAWPFTIILPGLFFFVGVLAGGRALSRLAIPGSVITMVGVILLYQSTFIHYESWAYAWALIPAAVGAGMFIDGRVREDADQVARGTRLSRLGLLLFAIGFVFFEIVLNLSNFVSRSLGGVVGPLLLIAAGLYFLIARGERKAPLSLSEAQDDLLTTALPVPQADVPPTNAPALEHDDETVAEHELTTRL